jgi:sugar lactone lactonase YvrE
MRLDLNTGGLLEVLPPSSYSDALSPDKKYLIYFDFPVNQIIILDLQTLSKVQVPTSEEYNYVGFFSWSPDSKKVIFVLAYDENWWIENNDSGFSLLLLDLDMMEITTLIQNDKRLLRPDFSSEAGYPWIGTNSIILSDKDRNLYVLELMTNSLSPKTTQTPTVSPTP